MNRKLNISEVAATATGHATDAASEPAIEATTKPATGFGEEEVTHCDESGDCAGPLPESGQKNYDNPFDLIEKDLGMKHKKVLQPIELPSPFKANGNGRPNMFQGCKFCLLNYLNQQLRFVPKEPQI